MPVKSNKTAELAVLKWLWYILFWIIPISLEFLQHAVSLLQKHFYIENRAVWAQKDAGEQFIELSFHLPLSHLLISPQARISLLLLLFHLLIYDHPLLSCCGPTCHVKHLLHEKKVSAGKRGLRTSSPAGWNTCSYFLPLWRKHHLSFTVRDICKLTHTC